MYVLHCSNLPFARASVQEGLPIVAAALGAYDIEGPVLGVESFVRMIQGCLERSVHIIKYLPST